jgi:hypothetical protein
MSRMLYPGSYLVRAGLQLGSSPPAAPTNLVVAPSPGNLGLTWVAPAGTGLTYKVYRGTSSGAETLLASSIVGTSYTDSTATPGTTYYYKVSAVGNGAGPLSNEASGRVPAGLIEFWSANSNTFQNNNLTTPAVANSDPVGSVGGLFKSRNLAYVGSKPALVVPARNGKNGISFDGSTQALGYTIQAGDNLAYPITVIAVLQDFDYGFAAANHFVTGSGASGADQGALLLSRQSSSNHWALNAGASSDPSTILPTSAATIASVTWRDPGNSNHSILYLNGNAVFTSSTGASASNFVAGTLFYLAQANGANPPSGKFTLLGIGIWLGILDTVTDRPNMEAWAAA